MSSQELKKKEKGKEIMMSFEKNHITSFHHVDHFDHTEEVTMYFSEEGLASLPQANKETYRKNIKVEQYAKKEDGEKVGIQEKKSSSSKITPCIFYTSDEKARLRWSHDLHDCFVNAVAKLGGPDKATPKTVKEMMEVEGIALHHVKSHLQKFRLGKCNIRNGRDQYHKRFRTARGTTKICASPILPRPQVNIRPKVMGALKPKKVHGHGSLYMLIEHDLHLQRCREAQRMQMASAIEKQHNMFGASMTPSVTYQHNNYTSTGAIITQQPSTQKQEQWLAPFPHHVSERGTNSFTMNDSQQPAPMIPKTTTFVEEFCNDNLACLSLSDFTQHSSNIQPAIGSSHQGTSSNAIPFWMKPLPVQTNIPHPTYGSYPPYNTLEMVETQLSALHDSSTSRIQETPSRETTLSSPVTRDDVDPVNKYIDWDKVAKMDFDLDPVEVLEALGFGVSSP